MAHDHPPHPTPAQTATGQQIAREVWNGLPASVPDGQDVVVTLSLRCADTLTCVAALTEWRLLERAYDAAHGKGK